MSDEHLGKRSAVHLNSGKSVDHSDPGLKGPTPPATAGRKPEACPPNLQPKSGQGSGDGVPSSSTAGAAVPSSLDPIEINRNKTQGRGKHCGRFSIRGTDPKSGKTQFRRVNCKSFSCAFCGPRRAARYKRAIRDTAEEMGLTRLLTLTLDPRKIQGDPVPYLNETWAKLRVLLRREFGESIKFIRVLEFQKNGNPHFHILVDRYIDQGWISRSWQSVGGGRIVDIRYVSIRQVSRYLSKYLTKEMLLSAPARCRRVTTSRDIRLLTKYASEIAWMFLKVPIWTLYKHHAAEVCEVSLDQEGVLELFAIFQNAE